MNQVMTPFTPIPHKHAEVIKAWADGKKIQFRSDQSKPSFNRVTFPDWADWGSKETPDFNTELLEFRVKPDFKYVKVGLVGARPAGLGPYFTCVNSKEGQEFVEANSVGFVKWISDWIEYESEGPEPRNFGEV